MSPNRLNMETQIEETTGNEELKEEHELTQLPNKDDEKTDETDVALGIEDSNKDKTATPESVLLEPEEVNYSKQENKENQRQKKRFLALFLVIVAAIILVVIVIVVIIIVATAHTVTYENSQNELGQLNTTEEPQMSTTQQVDEMYHGNITVSLDGVRIFTSDKLELVLNVTFIYALRYDENNSSPLVEIHGDQFELIVSVTAKDEIKGTAPDYSAPGYFHKTDEVETQFRKELKLRLEGNCCPGTPGNCQDVDICDVCSTSSDCNQGLYVDILYFKLDVIFDEFLLNVLKTTATP